MIDDSLLLFKYVFFNYSSLIVGVIGAALALTRWRRHPRVSLVILSAAMILIVQVLVTNVRGASSFSREYFRAFADPLVWVLFMAAGLGWRNRMSREQDISQGSQ